MRRGRLTRRRGWRGVLAIIMASFYHLALAQAVMHGYYKIF